MKRSNTVVREGKCEDTYLAVATALYGTCAAAQGGTSGENTI